MRLFPRFTLVLVWTLFLPVWAGAERIPVAEGIVVNVDLVPERWQLFRQAPPFLVAETAEHLEHELAAQGKNPGEAQIRQAAEKRLAANEAFLCNSVSGACLTIDFSPLRQDEAPPSARSIAASAKYAAEGLADEEGVSDLRQEQKKYQLPGAENAYRIDARFRQHGEPRQFIGIVGFSKPYWFFLYYSDPLRDGSDLADMEKMLKSLTLNR